VRYHESEASACFGTFGGATHWQKLCLTIRLLSINFLVRSRDVAAPISERKTKTRVGTTKICADRPAWKDQRPTTKLQVCDDGPPFYVCTSDTVSNSDDIPPVWLDVACDDLAWPIAVLWTVGLHSDSA